MFDLLEDNSQSGFEEEIPIPDGVEWKKRVKLNFEKEVLGIYASEHPLEPYEEMLSRLSKHTLVELAEQEKDIASGVFVGMVSGVTTKMTKRQTRMANFVLEDTTGYVECVCFKYEEFSDMLREDAVVKLKGKYEHSDRGNQLVAFSVDLIELSERDTKPPCLEITVSSSEYNQLSMAKLDNILKSHPGRDGVVLFLHQSDGRKFRGELPVTVDSSNPILRSEVQDLFGKAR